MNMCVGGILSMFSVIGIEDGVKDKGSRTWGIRGFTWTHTLSERSFSSPEQEAVGVPYIVVCLLAHSDIWATLQAVFFTYCGLCHTSF